MTTDLRTLLLGAVGLPAVLVACGPTVGTVTTPQPPGPTGPDYGECDPIVIDALNVLDDDVAPELGLQLRCSTDIDRATCIDECDEECQRGITAFEQIPNENGYDMWAECGPMWLDDGCCVAIWVEEFCCEGRPFLVNGVARVADTTQRRDWSEAIEPAPVPPAVRSDLAAHWLHAAQQEHASIAAFSRFSLVLLHLGAPADLVAATQLAGLDEVRHAQACFGLASAYGGVPVGPGPLLIDAALRDELQPVQVLTTLFKEGCVGETIASLLARAGSASATDPVVSDLLATIAHQEGQHAALAWKTVRWMLAEFPELRGTLEGLLATAAAPSVAADTPDHPVHGVLGSDSKRALISSAMREIIAPVGAQLLAPRSAPQDNTQLTAANV